jgi:plastocyanin
MLTRVDVNLLMFALAIAIGSAACGGGEPAASQPGGAPTTAAAPTDSADGPGVIAGTISFAGTPPVPRPLRMDSDPLCKPDAAGATSETLLIGPANGLQNVFVYVKDGLGARTYATPTTPATLDQNGCRYVPHVFGVQAGQTVNISNSDATLHNVHAMPQLNREFNFGQPARMPAAPRVFAKPEVMVPIRCDVHSFMNAYVGVVAHPFFAVTPADGTFEIKGLPLGTYTIEAWHEQLGTQTQSVTVTADAPAKVAISFKLTT